MLKWRQMGNMMTDYDILCESIELLQTVYTFIKDSGPPVGVSNTEWRNIHEELDGRSFNVMLASVKQLQRYGQLYTNRAIIGNNEVLSRSISTLT